MHVAFPVKTGNNACFHLCVGGISVPVPTVNESFWKPLTVKRFGRFVEYKAQLEASERHYYFDLLK